jgi:hypothetical protein
MNSLLVSRVNLNLVSDEEERIERDSVKGPNEWEGGESIIRNIITKNLCARSSDDSQERNQIRSAHPNARVLDNDEMLLRVILDLDLR